MDQLSDTAIARPRPVFKPGMPLETWVYGGDAYSKAPLFGGEVLMSPRQVAALLGMCTSQLDRMIEAGVGPPYFRFGPRLRRFLPSMVADWAKHCVEIAEFANTSNPGGNNAPPGSVRLTEDDCKPGPVATPARNIRPREVGRCSII
jgi:predicted DNA-binding transcriptional regulator AlpA